MDIKDEALPKEYTEQVVKRFCPQCGAAIEPNIRGRPKVFCSEYCRYKWKNAHPKPENWKSTRKAVCSVCGKPFLATREYERPREYCSRACANKARLKEWRKDSGEDDYRCVSDQQ